ncbi:hypothetical protein C1924_11760 [Stenotrophomonas sp. ESTM1D_MKCIP4_1]|uniref:hypothetical protein n=1 Tax=Stenotrophomonas sp. ESTM1D_MKCIP4_1 TaxID=2072414 RepID=UPI000D53CAE7|nr:hypothetical protein [Stenotrophomonas sp. ESTM1D_MKCIP4_1]AWH53800.1 hypothetical protein C1924_11760 [Stenotrophomonas sp. ESTM1D_MKCIP4_1]
MSRWNPHVAGAYAPACIGWLLALAGGLRLEQLRIDPLAQSLVPVLQWGVTVVLLVTLGWIIAASATLWRKARRPL